MSHVMQHKRPRNWGNRKNFANLVKLAEKADSDRPEIAQAKMFLAEK